LDLISEVFSNLNDSKLQQMGKEHHEVWEGDSSARTGVPVCVSRRTPRGDSTARPALQGAVQGKLQPGQSPSRQNSNREGTGGKAKDHGKAAGMESMG